MKKLITLFEASSSDFRNKIKSLGYTEKGGELTSGGDLQPGFLDILTKLLDDWKKTNPNCPVKFTAGNDSYHHTANPKSRHTKGEAADLTLDKSCHPAFIALLNTYKSKYNGFSYLNEYIASSAAKTGDHFHLSYRNGAPESGGQDYSGSEGSVTPSSGSTSSDTQIDPFGSFLNKAVENMGFGTPQNESKLEKNINKIKQLLK